MTSRTNTSTGTLTRTSCRRQCRRCRSGASPCRVSAASTDANRARRRLSVGPDGIERMFPTEIPVMTTDALGSEICSLGAHIAAATCRWLLLIGEFDRRGGAGHWECRSTAHWLNWRCGVSLHTAREYVRVALRLAELPAVADRFGRGELSYSKVRAISRIARPD